MKFSTSLKQLVLNLSSNSLFLLVHGRKELEVAGFICAEQSVSIFPPDLQQIASGKSIQFQIVVFQHLFYKFCIKLIIRPPMNACIQSQDSTVSQYQQSLCGASSSLLSVFLLLSLPHPYFCPSSCNSMRPLPSVWFCTRIPEHCPEPPRYPHLPPQTSIHTALTAILI